MPSGTHGEDLFARVNDSLLDRRELEISAPLLTELRKLGFFEADWSNRILQSYIHVRSAGGGFMPALTLYIKRYRQDGSSMQLRTLLARNRPFITAIVAAHLPEPVNMPTQDGYEKVPLGACKAEMAANDYYMHIFGRNYGTAASTLAYTENLTLEV